MKLFNLKNKEEFITRAQNALKNDSQYLGVPLKTDGTPEELVEYLRGAHAMEQYTSSGSVLSDYGLL